MRTLTTSFWPARNLTSDLWNEMDRLFENRATPGMPVYDEREFSPATEIAENENEYKLSVDLPGLKKEDIKIEVAENVLTISGERKREQVTEGHRYQRVEKTYGSFKRSFRLPNTVSADKIEAHFEDGVLGLSLPKAAAAQARQIEIQTAK